MTIDRLDAELIIAHVVKKPRSWVVSHDDHDLSEKELAEIQALLKRRQRGEPLAYILGEKEFYGRSFIVTPDVLIPRPATESLIDLAKEFLAGKNPVTREIDSGISAYVKILNPGAVKTIVDIGTGSGCIAITIGLELEQSARVYRPAGGHRPAIIGIDISEAALKIAKANQEKFQTKNIEFIKANGIEFVRSMKEPFLLVSNPPYIPSGTTLEKTVAEFEPHVALFSGKEGMDVIRPLIEAAKGNPMCQGVVIEMRTDQLRFVG